MNKKVYRSDMLLLLTAIIWGAGFVAQRVGMQHMGPFTFNGLRFILGAIVLIPFFEKLNNSSAETDGKTVLKAGISVGGILFIAASLQQIGLVYTTAGKAGFITGLYVIIVPLLGIFFGFRASLSGLLGAILATWGLYLLSIKEDLSMERGDSFVLLGAFFWALHVVMLGIVAPKLNGIKLASIQFGVCGILSLSVALFYEEISIMSMAGGIYPLLFGGLFSVAIAYTLQVVAQKNSPPVHTSIILSLESVFGALTGWLLLGEEMTTRGLTGCALMLTGMLTTQALPLLKSRIKRNRW